VGGVCFASLIMQSDPRAYCSAQLALGCTSRLNSRGEVKQDDEGHRVVCPFADLCEPNIDPTICIVLPINGVQEILQVDIVKAARFLRSRALQLYLAKGPLKTAGAYLPDRVMSV